MNSITGDQLEKYKKILNLNADLSIQHIIEQYLYSLSNWLFSKVKNEADLKLMIDAFKFFCNIDENEKIDDERILTTSFMILNNRQTYDENVLNIGVVEHFYMLGYVITKQINFLKLKEDEQIRIAPLLYQLFITIQWIERQYKKESLKIKTKKSEKNS